MSTSNHKQQITSLHASPVSSRAASTGEEVSSTAVDGDDLLLRLGRLAQELHGQSKSVVERLCQEIIDVSQGYVRLVVQPDSRLVQTHSYRQHSWLFVDVECAGRYYGKLAVAPHPTQPDQPVLLYQKIQAVATQCALILYSLESAAYFQQEYPSPVKLPVELTLREQETLELLCRGYQRKQIAARLHIQPGTVDKTYATLKTRLGAATEREVIAAAFRLGLISPIENLSANVRLSPAKQET